ncbi:helix-turn-helix transcriptional regulator [Campylobacter sp.]|uniref:helix-turn-helix domain-containing protein n=1 Tax=Campylobacter sp. TaxID=205 RepID=UPI002AA88D69|nr:helix-turn-helix transcriptional regulator [Campylobacter sp.]MCI7582748.1 helix-turn-helix domain-containing protein [Campylobacter sp.]
MKTHEKLAQMRKDAKLSRRELAEISGFNEHTILAYERNQNPASNEYLEFCSLYFGYEIKSIENDNLELKKMREAERVLKTFNALATRDNRDYFFDFDVDEFYDYNENEISLSETNSKILNDMIGTLHLNANDYTPDKYAEIVRVSLSARKLEKSKQYSKQDLELLALLNSLDAEIKDNLKALIKSIIAKGGKM